LIRFLQPEIIKMGGFHKTASIGVQGAVKQLMFITNFNKLPKIHNGHSICHNRDYAKIVGDQQVTNSTLLLPFEQ
jgi:hypothetical protein